MITNVAISRAVGALKTVSVSYLLLLSGFTCSAPFLLLGLRTSEQGRVAGSLAAFARSFKQGIGQNCLKGLSSLTRTMLGGKRKEGKKHSVTFYALQSGPFLHPPQIVLPSKAVSWPPTFAVDRFLKVELPFE